MGNIFNAKEPIYGYYKIDCHCLLDVYKYYLEPYIGPMRYFIDYEKLIIGEFQKELEKQTVSGDTTLMGILSSLDVSPDIADNFCEEWYNTTENLLYSILSYLNGRMVIDFSFKPGYLLEATVVYYN